MKERRMHALPLLPGEPRLRSRLVDRGGESDEKRREGVVRRA